VYSNCKEHICETCVLQREVLSILNERGQLSQYRNGLWAGWLGFDSQHRWKICLYSRGSKMVLGLTRSPTQWLSEVKQPGHEVGHSPPYIAKVKNVRVYLPLSHMPSWCGAQLIKHRDVTFTSDDFNCSQISFRNLCQVLQPVSCYFCRDVRKHYWFHYIL
jgi:hypothetical protein